MFENFSHCNAAVSDLYDGKSKNEIAVVFFLIPMAVGKMQEDELFAKELRYYVS